MCGLVAILAPDGGFDERLLDAMRDRMMHRGPDGCGSWTGTLGASKAGLAHRRLSIIDLSREAGQPMFSPDVQHAVIFNGEIYNYVELREELRRLGVQFRTRSDTEVLLAAYAQWGPKCLTRLNGMFAFVILDARLRQLFVARDRFGEKPLFHARPSSGGIVFASEMKALFAHPGISADVNERTLDRYQAGTYYEDGEETFFRGVQRVPPATAMIVASDGSIVRQWRYWVPDYTAVRDDYRDAEAPERFLHLLRESIRLRLRSDVPVGTSLSGGLDSSSLVCILAGLRDTHESFTQKSFSARFDDDPTISEGPQIDTVVQHAGIPNFSVSPDPLRLIEESRRLHWHQEEPFLSASIYLQWCVARLARENSTTVLIDGQGADELLGGYQFYFRNYQLDCAERGRPVKALAETWKFTGRLRSASAQYAMSSRRFNSNIAYSPVALLGHWLRPPGVYAGPYETGVPPPVKGMRLRRQMAEALQYNCLPTLLRYADRNSMAHSREVRLPFLDYELTDWCISLPDEAFIDDGWQKHILRKAVEGIVPPAVQWRADKVGYAAPLDLWLRGVLKDWAHAHLFEGPVTELTGYDRSSLRRMWDTHQTGAQELSWPLWRWISLNEWLLMTRAGTWREGMAA